MRKHLIVVLGLTLALSLTACGGNKGKGDVQGEAEVVTETTEASISPEGVAWREAVLKNTPIAEVENKDTKYEVYVSDSIKYIHNTKTDELITGTSVGDADGTVLKDWISPYGKTKLKSKEALFDGTWAYTSDRIRGLIGYCDAKYKLVTRARTADYLEYIYEDKANKTTYRIAVTDEYILFAPLAFTYVFDVNAY